MPKNLTSERQAWTAVKRYASHITGSNANREARAAIDGIADTMLEQLTDGVHVNPSLVYVRAIGGRIRKELERTNDIGLAERVTHQLMIGRADKVSDDEAQQLVNALRAHGHERTAAQLAEWWNKHVARGT